MKLLPAIFLLAASGMLCAQNKFKAYCSNANRLIEAGNYNGGIKELNKALANQDDAPNIYKVVDALLYRAFCYNELNKPEAAQPDIDRALVLKPEYVKAYEFKCRNSLDLKKHEDCISWCDKGLALNSSNDRILTTKAWALLNLKKHAEARQACFALIEHEPKHVGAYRLVAATYSRQKMWDSAVAYYSKAIDIDPLNAASFYDRGIDKSMYKDYSGAKDDIEKAMRLDTTNLFIGYNNLGFFLKLEQKDYAGAIEYFNKAIALEPGEAMAYNNRGFAKLNLGDTKGAMADVKKAISLDKTNSYAYKNMGLIYLKLNKTTLACKNFMQALQLDYTYTYDDEVEKLIAEHCK